MSGNLTPPPPLALCSPYGNTHQPPILNHHHHHHHSVSGVGGASVHAEALPVQLSTSPHEDSSITVLESGGNELKRSYSQHHDLNNNGNIYQNLTPIHHVKSESSYPVEGSVTGASAAAAAEGKANEALATQLNSNDISSERPRCWTKM